MTDRELLEKIFEGMQEMRSDIEGIKSEIKEMKSDIRKLDTRLTKIELTLENETNHNIQLLAENHITLINKLNEAIKVSDKTLMFEVQISGLRMKVEKLEQEVAEVKKSIA